MGGHRDELELALDKPIVSISLGRPAVFVLGGKTLQDGPIIPMIVRSGDVIVMGGEARLNYHSMARLLPRTFLTTPPPMMMMEEAPCLVITPAQVGMVRERPLSPHDVEMVDRYLANHRININIRQVYK
jgi:2OG-Fe(II) oxygenase superfamily